MGRAVLGHWSGLRGGSGWGLHGSSKAGWAPVRGLKMKGWESGFYQQCPFPRKSSCPGTLTPSNEEEEPLAQVLRGVRHDNGRVQVAALHKHPEEVGDHKVVEDGGDAAAPDLHVGSGGVVRDCWGSRAGPTGSHRTLNFGTHGQGSKCQLPMG